MKQFQKYYYIVLSIMSLTFSYYFINTVFTDDKNLTDVVIALTNLILFLLMSLMVIKSFKKINKIENSIDLLSKGSLKSLNDKEIDDCLTLKKLNVFLLKEEIKNEEDRKVTEEILKMFKNINNGIFFKRINLSSKNENLNKLIVQTNESLNTLETIFTKVQNSLRNIATLNFSQNVFLEKELGKFNSNVSTIDISNESISNIINYLNVYSNELDLNLKTLNDNIKIFNEKNNQQVAFIEEVSASVEQISGNIRNNTETTIKLANFSKEVKNSNLKSKELSTQTVKIIEEIIQEQKNISESLKIIESIAFQTNILSLNARVERATAGEAGKGFAVVRQEVRNLANRSAEASKTIKEIVDKANVKTQNGKNIILQMEEGVNTLNSNIERTLIMINDISTASKEQNQGIRLISENMNNMDKNIQNNATIMQDVENISNVAKNVSNHLLGIVKQTQINKKSLARNNNPEIILQFSKLKMAHVDFKDTNLFADNVKVEDIKNHTNCLLANMLIQLEKEVPEIKNSNNYKKMNEHHKNVHDLVINYVKEGRIKNIDEVGKEVEENTQKLFGYLDGMQLDILEILCYNNKYKKKVNND